MLQGEMTMKKILSAITAATVLLGTTAAYATVSFPIPETPATSAGSGPATASNPWEGPSIEYSNYLQVDAKTGLVRLKDVYNNDENNSNPNYLEKRKEINIINIPETMEASNGQTITVTGVDKGAFRGCTNLFVVDFPDSSEFKLIETNAFEGCVNLQAVIFPDHLTTINDSAFRYCSKLKVVDIPASVTYIGSFVFNTCKKLKAINVDQGNRNYFSEDGVLFNKAEPNQNNYLMQYPAGKDDRTEYTALGTVNSVSIKNIDVGAFEANEYLKEVTIASAYSSIGRAAFFDCTALEKVTISGNVQKIQDDTFSGCKLLKTIVLPAGLEEIGTNAFFNCKELLGTDDGTKGMVIPDGVDTIGAGAFINCEKLTSITIPSSTHTIRYSYTNPKYSWYEGYLWHSGYQDFDWLKPDNQYNQYEGYEGFFLAGCTGMLDINVKADNPNYYDHDGVLYEKIKNYATSKEDHYLVHYPLGRKPSYSGDQGYNYAVPNGVFGVRSTAFSLNKNLRVVVIPATVTVIEDYAFSDSVLTDVTIKGKIESINSTLFKGCTELEYITFDKDCGLKTIDDNAFDGCKSLYSIKPLPESLETIGSFAFNDCTSLKTIELPDSVTTIKDHAFSNSGLTSFSIPEKVTTINESVFEGCAALKKITIPEYVTEIYVKAFKNSGLQELTISSAATELNVVPKNAEVAEVAEDAEDDEDIKGSFAKCLNLTKVHIPKGVEEIIAGVFHRDDFITDVYFGGTEEEWNAVIINENNGALNNLEKVTVHYGYGGSSGNTGSGGDNGDDDDDNKKETDIVIDLPNSGYVDSDSLTVEGYEADEKGNKGEKVDDDDDVSIKDGKLVYDLEDGDYFFTFSAKNCAPRTYKVTIKDGEIESGLEDGVVLHLYGDLNNDGKVDISDAVVVYSYIKGQPTLEGYYLAVADVNKDGKIGMGDLAGINDHMVGDILLWS